MTAKSRLTCWCLGGVFIALLGPFCEAKTVRGINLASGFPAPDEKELAVQLRSYLGQEFTDTLANEVADLVLQHYRSRDHPVVLVSVDLASFRSGVLTVQIAEGVVGQISKRGGVHLADPTPLLQSGELLTGTRMQSELDWLNRNPFHSATLAATPGDSPHVANLEFQLSDQLPFAAWMNYGNDGIEPLGEHRWLAGMSVGDLFQFDHTLTFQAQMAEEYALYHALMAEWKLRFPWHHELAMIGALVGTESPAIDGITVEGEAWTAGASYIVPWRASLTMHGETWVKFEAKHFNNVVFFGGQNQLQQPLDVATFALGTKLSLTGKSDTLDLSAEAVYSRGNLWGGSSDEEYSQATPGADSTFFYVRANAAWTHMWDNRWSCISQIGGQWADGPLLASESYYLTGANAVRGYRERSIIGASSIRTSLEIRTPLRQLQSGRGIPPLSRLTPPSMGRLQWQALCFADAGHTWTQQAQTDTPTSVGAGIRAQLGNWGQLRCDAAWPLKDGLEPRVHVNLTLYF